MYGYDYRFPEETINPFIVYRKRVPCVSCANAKYNVTLIPIKDTVYLPDSRVRQIYTIEVACDTIAYKDKKLCTNSTCARSTECSKESCQNCIYAHSIVLPVDMEKYMETIPGKSKKDFNSCKISRTLYRCKYMKERTYAEVGYSCDNFKGKDTNKQWVKPTITIKSI